MNLGLIGLRDSIKKALLYFTERRSNTGVNSTTPVHQIAATGGAETIDLALTPKGVGALGGALCVHIPDQTLLGGNKRGTNAVDWQARRTLASEVASGSESVISGGWQNTASGAASVVSGGNANTASQIFSTVSGGASNTASGNQSTVSGGASNTASNTSSTVSGGISNTALNINSTVSGGASNTASGFNSTISGGSRATTNGIQGLWAYGFNGTSLGQNQMSFFGARPSTTDATAKRATADDAAAATINQLTLRNNSAFKFEGRVIARDTATNDAKEWSFRGLIKRGAAAANTSLVGTPTITSEFADTAASTWTLAVSADTTNGALAVNVTGETAKTIRWTVVVWSQEVA